MKKILFFIFFIAVSAASFAHHISGGEIIYEYLGPGGMPNSKSYKITLRLFRDEQCQFCAVMPSQVVIAIFDYGTKQYANININSHDTINKTFEENVYSPSVSCVNGDTSRNYRIGYYSDTMDLPDNADGYLAVYETCCRVDTIRNVSPQIGAIYDCRIPGTNILGSRFNSSPQFSIILELVCQNSPFTMNFHASDPDGDSLVYSFTDAYREINARDASPIDPVSPSSTPPPDYPLVPYINGYTGAVPLGITASINSNTGIITGIAPDAGDYIVCVIIKEYRNGLQIGEHRKDFMLKVRVCNFPQAKLKPEYITCDGFTLSFNNNAPDSNITNYYWDFNDPPSGINNTSTSPTPTHTFSDTGIYLIKFIVNKDSSCTDSTVSTVKIYDGFWAGFISNGPFCTESPAMFSDTSLTKFGFVDTWKWNFGDGNADNDTSSQQNPSYNYSLPGTFNVQLIVTNSKGCIDTVNNPITIYTQPKVVAGLDIAVCMGYDVPLYASGGGSIYQWTPATFLNNPNIPNPIARMPDQSIQYVVTIRDTTGCTNPASDTLFVKIYPPPSVVANPQKAYAVEGEAIELIATGAVRYYWSPVDWLTNPNIPNPVSYPQQSVTYIVEGLDSIGCSAKDTIEIKFFNVDPDVYTPTIFTPNGDGVNDIFKPIWIGMRSIKALYIYNRWGELVFHTTDINKGWDGTFKGKPQSVGNFVWRAEGITFQGITKVKKGNVILYR